MFIGIELKINWQFSVYIKVFLNHPASRLKFLWFRMHNNTNAYHTQTAAKQSNHPSPKPKKKKKFIINTFIHLSYYYFLFVFGYLTYIHTKSVFFSFPRARIFLFFSSLFFPPNKHTKKRSFCWGKRRETCDKWFWSENEWTSWKRHFVHHQDESHDDRAITRKNEKLNEWKKSFFGK